MGVSKASDLFSERFDARDKVGEKSSDTVAAHLGFIEFVDSDFAFDCARPLWCAAFEPSVITADIVDDCPTVGNGIDLLAVASLVTLAADENDDEHLLLSDGKFSVRLDINGGTLLGAPSLLSYRTSGIARLEAPIATLKRLVVIIRYVRLTNSERAPRASLDIGVARRRCACRRCEPARNR